jgi:pimeloyl-ACP methyl ester carboxylesterase
MPNVSTQPYDEFSFFHENLSEWSLDVAIPAVSRFFVSVDGLRQLSGLRWGTDEPELVLVHGGAQNAHTYDTVALALQRPLLALDLPGHGHSDAPPLAATAVANLALDVARALDQLTTGPLPLVGMSLGGLTSLLVARDRPDLVRSLALIDITPGVNEKKSHHITDFINGPASFADFDELLARTMEHNPSRTESSLRRGIMHNAVQREDGTWVWRHQRSEHSRLEAPDGVDLWAALALLTMPVTLIRAMGAGSVVDDEDEVEFLRLRPDATIVHVADSGHSVQGDQPLVLARLLDEFCVS